MTNTERLIRLKVISEEMSKIHNDLCSNTKDRWSWEASRSDEALDIVLGISKLMSQFEQIQEPENQYADIVNEHLEKYVHEEQIEEQPFVDANIDLQRRLHNAKHGDIVIMHGKKYKVLKTDKRFVKLLSMYDVDTSIWGKATYYLNSQIFQRLNDFVRSLPDKIQNSIVTTTVPCYTCLEVEEDIYGDGSENYDALQIELNPDRFSFEAAKYQYLEIEESYNMVQAKAFLPSIKDIEEFYSKAITSKDIQKLFYDGNEGIQPSIGLRDSWSLDEPYVLGVNPKDSSIDHCWCGDKIGVRAIFTMDITKLL